MRSDYERSLVNLAGICALVGILALLLLFQGCAAPTKERRAFLTSCRGMSMHPQIREGDLLAVLPAKAEEIELGQVVVFEGNKRNGWPAEMRIAHRVIGRGLCRGWLITKGDNNDATDPGYVTNENLLGVVTAHISR